MAQAALDAGQIEMARRLYGRLLEVAPESVEARMGLGRVAMAEQDPSQAASWHLSALTYAATPEERHRVLLAHGRAALAAGQHAEALRSFARLAHPEENAPARLAAWGINGIGVVRWLDGDPQGAVDAMEQAVLRDPTESAFRDNMAAAVEMLATLDLGAAPDPDRPAVPEPDMLTLAPTEPVPTVTATVPDVPTAAPTDPVETAPVATAVASPLSDAAPPEPHDEMLAAPAETTRCSWWLFTWPCEKPPMDEEATAAEAQDAPPAANGGLAGSAAAATAAPVAEAVPRGTVPIPDTVPVNAPAPSEDVAPVDERTEGAELEPPTEEGIATLADVAPPTMATVPATDEEEIQAEPETPVAEERDARDTVEDVAVWDAPDTAEADVAEAPIADEAQPTGDGLEAEEAVAESEEDEPLAESEDGIGTGDRLEPAATSLEEALDDAESTARDSMPTEDAPADGLWINPIRGERQLDAGMEEKIAPPDQEAPWMSEADEPESADAEPPMDDSAEVEEEEVWPAASSIHIELGAEALRARVQDMGGFVVSTGEGQFVQLAALSELHAANALADYVREMMDFNVSIAEVDSVRGRVWRVRIGPIETDAELALVVEELEAGEYSAAAAGTVTAAAKASTAKAD